MSARARFQPWFHGPEDDRQVMAERCAARNRAQADPSPPGWWGGRVATHAAVDPVAARRDWLDAMANAHAPGHSDSRGYLDLGNADGCEVRFEYVGNLSCSKRVAVFTPSSDGSDRA